ncbi:MAG TPA: hypothetical protein VMM78_02755 [Thermomicrobiales bacterium]|nr:hypothetical protein [Thermomicrobiales bacterium]
MSAIPMTNQAGRGSLLRRVLLADSLVSGGAGLLLLAAAGPLHDTLGLPAALLRVAGVTLLPWCALLIYAARRPVTPRRVVWSVVGVNLLWVAGSALLLVSGWVDPTGLGMAFVIAQAVAVLAFADLQLLGLRRP